MFGISFPELIVILIIALVVIGPKNFPEVARSLGKAYAEFQRAFRNLKDSIDLDSVAQNGETFLNDPKNHIINSNESSPENSVQHTDPSDEKREQKV